MLQPLIFVSFVRIAAYETSGARGPASIGGGRGKNGESLNPGSTPFHYRSGSCSKSCGGDGNPVANGLWIGQYSVGSVPGMNHSYEVDS